MKKGIYICLGTVLVLFAIYILDTQFLSKERMPGIGAVENDSTSLISFPLLQLDGSRLTMSELEGGKILVLIRPDCAPCQRKALQIQENAGAFEEYEILFVSDASLPQLRQIASSYNRAGQRNIYIAQAATKDILHLFGSAEAPSILVFSKEGRLVDTFSGRTPIQEILASL